MSDLGIPPRPGEPPRALTQAIVRLLRPLVRVLIAHGVTFPMLAKLLKDIYVGVAEEAFPLSGKVQTDSRLSLLTGVHRKDVRALRGRGRATDRPSPVVSRNAQMMALWAGDPNYLDARGRPRALPRTGGRPSFDSLVESVSKDIRPRVVLDEWQRLGLIRIDEQARVHLNNVAFVPRHEFDDLAYYFGRNLRDHIAASGHNLGGNEPPMLERAVYYEKLTPQSIDELANYTRGWLMTSSHALHRGLRRGIVGIAASKQGAAAMCAPVRPGRARLPRTAVDQGRQRRKFLHHLFGGFRPCPRALPAGG
jgi:hypothetical protein